MLQIFLKGANFYFLKIHFTVCTFLLLLSKEVSSVLHLLLEYFLTLVRKYLVFGWSGSDVPWRTKFGALSGQVRQAVL